MSTDHIALIVSTPNGYLPSCQCGWRSLAFVGHPEAVQMCDEHERNARLGRLNAGPRPTAKTAAKTFRENATNPVYTEEERLMWSQLAIEMEQELDAQRRKPLEGQISLFD